MKWLVNYKDNLVFHHRPYFHHRANQQFLNWCQVHWPQDHLMISLLEVLSQVLFLYLQIMQPNSHLVLFLEEIRDQLSFWKILLQFMTILLSELMDRYIWPHRCPNINNKNNNNHLPNLLLLHNYRNILTKCMMMLFNKLPEIREWLVESVL